MSVLLLTAVFAVAAEAEPKTAAKMDGKWMIVYAEEGGRRNNTWEQRLATLSQGTLSYEGEGGKKRSLKLKFGKHQTVESTVEEKTRHGVYILGQDYLCISLEAGAQHASSGDFILILRRQRGKAAQP